MKMNIIISNAFSLSMLDRENQKHAAGDAVYENPRIPRPCDYPQGFLAAWEKAGAEVESAVGHADTAAVFSTLLGRPVPVNRVNIKLTQGVILLVGQYIGPRLPEGATTLPEGARIEWWTV
jgi:hypothetical protein